jgi:hypothetical protein
MILKIISFKNNSLKGLGLSAAIDSGSLITLMHIIDTTHDPDLKESLKLLNSLRKSFKSFNSPHLLDEYNKLKNDILLYVNDVTE